MCVVLSLACGSPTQTLGRESDVNDAMPGLPGVYSRLVVLDSGETAIEELELHGNGDVIVKYEDCEGATQQSGTWWVNRRGQAIVQPDDAHFNAWRGYSPAGRYVVTSVSACAGIEIRPSGEGSLTYVPSDADIMGFGNYEPRMLQMPEDKWLCDARWGAQSTCNDWGDDPGGDGC